jgi:hypothetical protein
MFSGNFLLKKKNFPALALQAAMQSCLDSVYTNYNFVFQFSVISFGLHVHLFVFCFTVFIVESNKLLCMCTYVLTSA